MTEFYLVVFVVFLVGVLAGRLSKKDLPADELELLELAFLWDCVSTVVNPTLTTRVAEAPAVFIEGVYKKLKSQLNRKSEETWQ